MEIKTKRAKTDIQPLTEFQIHNLIHTQCQIICLNYKPKYTMIQTFHKAKGVNTVKTSHF